MSVAFKSRRPEVPRTGLLVLALTLAAGFGAQAKAQDCDLRLRRAPEAVRIDYDPFVVARPPGRLDLDLVNEGAATCDLELRLLDLDGQPLRALDLGGVGIGFRAREGSAIVAGGAEPNRFRLSLAPGVSVAAQFDVVVVSDAVAEAGEHRGSVRVEIGSTGSDAPLRTDPVDIVLASPPRAQMNIAGAAGAFGASDSVEVIDFGEARTGAVRRAFLQVRANTEAVLTFQSQNSGVMKRPGSMSEESVIDYIVTLDGRVLDLRHGDRRTVDPPRHLDGQSLSLDFELGAVGPQMAGRYEDLLTISISPD